MANNESKKDKTPFWQPAMVIFAEVSAWIAGPIVIALFLGRWLDNRYQTEPWLFLGTMGLAFAVSSFGIVKITLNYIKKIEKEVKNKNNEPTNGKSAN